MTKRNEDHSFNRRDVLKAAGAVAASTLIIPATVFAADGSEPIATTRAGKIRGAKEGGIYVFKGVRYGADTAKTRFQAPQAPQPWNGIVDALDYGNQTPQASAGDGGGLFKSWANRRTDSEDCLFLNVWTPGLRDQKKRPVMVWFHGGGFSSGSGASHAYDGVRLAKRGDVVVVTVNHRLNVFGHLYLTGLGVAEMGDGKFADSGNVGVLDLVHSLQWVRDNIAEFGGDPGSVMIFGESGGGAKVTTLMAMPAAKGLFHRAAVQSGAWLLFNEADASTKVASAVIAELGLTPQTLDRISSLPFATIQQAADKASRAVRDAGWGPVIDRKNLTRHPFTPDAPPESRQVPLLIGMNRTESTLLVGPRDPMYFNMTWEALPEKLQPLLPGIDVAKVLQEYRTLHPKYDAPDTFFAVTTDSRFLRAHVAQVERKAQQAGAPAYFYMLDWDTPVDGGKWRAPHALEIGFVFDNVTKSESMSGIGAEQQRIADLMSTSWIAFARTGDPNNSLVPKWPAYDVKARPSMVFAPEPRIANDIRGKERRLFDALKMSANG
jgi:para-nitrobenzyl esterase